MSSARPRTPVISKVGKKGGGVLARLLWGDPLLFPRSRDRIAGTSSTVWALGEVTRVLQDILRASRSPRT